MSTDATDAAPAAPAADAEPAAPPAPETPASGVPLAVFAFGFSVIILSMANAGWIDARAGLFVPVAFGTGALGMLVGGLMEYRRGSLFGGTFALSYACFLLTTPLILQFFAEDVTTLAGALAFGQAFGAYLLLWAIFTAFLAYGTYYIALPGFLAFVLLVIVYLLAGIGFMERARGSRPDHHRRLGRDTRRVVRILAWHGAAAESHGAAPDHPARALPVQSPGMTQRWSPPR